MSDVLLVQISVHFDMPPDSFNGLPTVGPTVRMASTTTAQYNILYYIFYHLLYNSQSLLGKNTVLYFHIGNILNQRYHIGTFQNSRVVVVGLTVFAPTTPPFLHFYYYFVSTVIQW